MQSVALGIANIPLKSLQYCSSLNGDHFNSHSQFLNTKIKFLTLEHNCLKIWEYTSGNVDLVNKIQIKQPIKQCIVADLTGFLIILGENGKVIILD